MIIIVDPYDTEFVGGPWLKRSNDDGLFKRTSHYICGGTETAQNLGRNKVAWSRAVQIVSDFSAVEAGSLKVFYKNTPKIDTKCIEKLSPALKEIFTKIVEKHIRLWEPPSKPNHLMFLNHKWKHESTDKSVGQKIKPCKFPAKAKDASSRPTKGSLEGWRFCEKNRTKFYASSISVNLKKYSINAFSVADLLQA